MITLAEENKRIESLLASIVLNMQRVLQDNLVGIYLHGSLAMGCFNPKSSDIDFLIIIKDEINTATKKEIIQILLLLSDQIPENGIEMSVLLKQAVIDFVYPTPFVLHYSNAHKERYLQDPNYLCGNDKDPDLAAHIVVTMNRGIGLYGEEILSIFKPIPDKYYIASILCDLEDVECNVINAPVYNVLNMCRFLQYLRERIISSKAEGGEWALRQLPPDYTDTVKKALSVYKQNKIREGFLEKELTEFASYMMNQITTQLARDNGQIEYGNIIK